MNFINPLHDIGSELCGVQNPAGYVGGETGQVVKPHADNDGLFNFAVAFPDLYSIAMSNQAIKIIYNGWEHYKTVQADKSVFKSYPQLEDKKYYFTLGSLSRRKNLKWVAEYAEKHQEDTFVISGKSIATLVTPELTELQHLGNVILPGYLSDGQVKALMEHCKAFVFPSYYEGFGIPPLEALSCGARIIISDAASLPELYQDCAHYINPDSTAVSLDTLLNEKVSSPKKLLKLYSYDKAAAALKDAILTL